jgi:ABC-type multidrug transport system ATPase subunit
LDEVSKRWDGGSAALNRVTYSFLEGRTYVITGRSGAGKTTLLNVLAGYVVPDAGRVTRRGPVGYLFQDDLLFSALSVRSNVVIAANARVGVADRVPTIDDRLESVGLLHLAEHRAALLSGGEKKRLQLAQILAGRPHAVLFDEPCSSLDEEAIAQVCGVIDGAFEGCTKVVVTHDMSLLERLTEPIRLLLKDGRLVGE